MENTIRVTGRLTVGSCINQAKRRLESTSEVELHAVGFSILTALRAALRLEEFKYISSCSLTTETVTEADRSLRKVVVKLTKSPDFDRIHAEFTNSQQTT